MGNIKRSMFNLQFPFIYPGMNAAQLRELERVTMELEQASPGILMKDTVAALHGYSSIEMRMEGACPVKSFFKNFDSGTDRIYSIAIDKYWMPDDHIHWSFDGYICIPVGDGETELQAVRITTAQWYNVKLVEGRLVCETWNGKESPIDVMERIMRDFWERWGWKGEGRE